MATDSTASTDHINPVETTAATMVAVAAAGLSRAALHPSRDGRRETPTLPPTPTGKAFCCYILASDQWSTPYTGKTCDLARRLRSHNNPSARSRAYTKGKGPWRVAAAVFGLRSNRQSVWLERALKKHAKHRARPAGLNAIQTAVLDAVHVSSHLETWWPKGPTQAARAAAASDPPPLHLHIFKTVLAPRAQKRVGCNATPSSGSGNIVSNMSLSNKTLRAAVTGGSVRGIGTNTRLVHVNVHCHRYRNYTP
jgi:predicted GIY-YIG superfamily endonuclease